MLRFSCKVSITLLQLGVYAYVAILCQFVYLRLRSKSRKVIFHFKQQLHKASGVKVSGKILRTDTCNDVSLTLGKTKLIIKIGYICFLFVDSVAFN